MPSGGRTVIVSGGIQNTSPFTIGTIPVIVATSPPAISDSLLSQSPVAVPTGIIVTALGDPSVAATETLRWRGGIISEAVGFADSTVMGRGATVGAANQVVIGVGANGGTVASTVAIGRNATVVSSGTAIGNSATANGVNCLAVGQSSSATNPGGTGRTVAIGPGASSNKINSVAVGADAVVTANSATVVGSQATCAGSESVVIGAQASVGNGLHSIAIGFGAAVNADAAICISAGSSGPTFSVAATGSILIGGTRTTPPSVTHADNILIGMSGATFAANVAQIGATGTTINTVVVGRGDTFAGQTPVTIRLTDRTGAGNLAGSNLVIRSGAGVGSDVTAAQIQFQTPVVAAAGATQTFATRVSIFPSGGLSVAAPDVASITMAIAGFGGAGVASLSLTNLTDGAAAAAGTLNNAPSAGDPAIWVPIRINGNLRFFPCWA